METITTQTDVYEFHELDDKAKEKALDDVRNDEWYPGDWWSECMVENFVEDRKKEGWYLDSTDVHFDVGYCQGSGASFDATLDVSEYLKVNKLLSKFPRVRKWADEGQISGKIHTNSYANHYCHFNTRYFELEADMYYDALDPEYEKKLNWEIEDLEKHIEEDREQISRDLEKKAYETYEWYMKDEVIQEDLEANEARFTKDGNSY